MTVAQIPEQIAYDEIVRKYGPGEVIDREFVINGAELRDLIAAGIKTHEEQNRSRLEGLSAWDYQHADDDGEVDKYLVVQIDTSDDIGRMRVYINDGNIYDGDPEHS